MTIAGPRASGFALAAIMWTAAVLATLGLESRGDQAAWTASASACEQDSVRAGASLPGVVPAVEGDASGWCDAAPELRVGVPAPAWSDLDGASAVAGHRVDDGAASAVSPCYRLAPKTSPPLRL